MTSLRDERAAALIRRHRDLSDDFTRALPGLLDDLEAIDQAHVPDGVIRSFATLSDEEAAEFAEQWVKESKGDQPAIPPGPCAPTDAEIEKWALAHPDKVMAIGMRKAVRPLAADPPLGRAAPDRVPPVPVSDKPPRAPATRRRTGGTHA